MIKKIKTKFPESTESIFNECQQLVPSLPWENKEFYKQWLAQTYHMVAHTPRFICLAAARFGVDQDQWHRALVDHFSDEDKHEYLLLENLKSLGGDLKDFPQLPETAMIVQQLYYAIDHWSPTSIFGRILFLEALVAQFPESFKEKIKKNYTDAENSFICVHFDEDIDHVEKAYERIQSLPKEELAIVGDNFYLSGFLYKQFLQAIAKAADKKSSASDLAA